MDRLERKALLIMAAIGAAEIVALAAVVAGHNPSTIQRLLIIGTPIGWLLAAATAALFIYLTIRRLPLIGERAFDFSYFKLAGVVFGLLAGVAEEFWYRKIPMDALARAHQGWAVQIVASAVLFGVAHGVWGVFGGRWRAAAAAMTATGALGAALAIVYLVGGRSLAPCIWAHVAIDVVLEPWLLLAVLNMPKPRLARPKSGPAVPPPLVWPASQGSDECH